MVLSLQAQSGWHQTLPWVPAFPGVQDDQGLQVLPVLPQDQYLQAYQTLPEIPLLPWYQVALEVQACRLYLGDHRLLQLPLLLEERGAHLHPTSS